MLSIPNAMYAWNKRESLRLLHDKVFECELYFNTENGHKLNVEQINLLIESVAMYVAAWC